MQTNITDTKFSHLVNIILNNLMVALGTLSIIWVLAFLIVAMFGE